MPYIHLPLSYNSMYRMKNREAAIIFIFITMLIDIIGFGIIIPVLPKLLAQMNNIPINEASRYGGYLLFAFAFAQFLFSPIMGSLSDQYGRRPVLLISLLGFTVDYLILAFAPDYFWFFVGRVIAGMTGASFTTASAYIADISTPETRTKNFGMIGAAFGLGFIIGPFLGGVLGQYGLKLPFYAAAILSFLNFLYGYFILPESLSVENRRPFDIKRANPLGAIIQITKFSNLKYLLVAFVLLNIGSHAIQSNWSYFTMYRFNWDEAIVGYSLAFVGVLVAVVQTILAQKSAIWFGIKNSIVIGFGLYALGMLLFAFASQSWMMFAFLIPYCLGGIAMPNLQSYMAGEVGPKGQGELQGGLTSLMSTTTIIGPLLMTGTFYYFTTAGAPFIFPGSAFLLGAILMGTSMVISWYVLLRKPSNP
jgi:MFS transporter, DHA1 family, tetracycline resistance protein